MIYLDNAATTKPSIDAKNAVLEAMETFGNPSSLHKMGLMAEKLIKSSALEIANSIGAKPGDIIFTSGGTESNNTAIFSARRSKKRHIITSQIEHPSVLEPVRQLEREGFKVSFVSVKPDGIIDLDELKRELNEDTALISIMHVNNETGAIQPIGEIKKLINELAPQCKLHIDAVQSFMKIPLSVRDTGADYISLSSHKIHGIKGTGALYVKNQSVLNPLIIGGGQQNGIRSGTQNVPGIYAFGTQVKALKNAENSDISSLRKRLLDGIIENIPNSVYNGSETEFSPYILNVSFLGIKSEILLHYLESEDIYVSTGSACSSNKPEPSHVLKAMGKTMEEIIGAVRFSFSSDITNEDIDKTIYVLAQKVSEIRKYIR